MKIEKISDDMLKITLNVSDMTKWNVSKETLHPGNPNSKEMFWDIIHLASEATGVEFSNCKLTVEAVEKDAETFVIFITKKDVPADTAIPRRYKYRKTSGEMQENSSVMVYTFEDFNDICNFSKNNLYFCLLFENNNSLYKHNDMFRLVVTITPALKEHISKFNNAVSEYALQVENSYIYASYLEEHHTPMIEKTALKTLYDKF